MLDQRQVPVSFFFLFNLFHSFFLARGTLMFTSSLLVSTPRRCLHACYPALRHTLATLCAKKKFFLNDTNSHFNFFFKKYNWKLSYVNRFWSSPQNQYQRHSISTTKLAISISQPKKKKKKLLRVVKDDSNSLFFYLEPQDSEPPEQAQEEEEQEQLEPQLQAIVIINLGGVVEWW